jgi:uncharacterized protein YbjQ (UPF0145 family)
MVWQVALAAAGAGISLLGAQAQARATERAASYNASISDRNARVAERAADQARQLGEQQIVDFRTDFRRLEATVQTRLIKAGIDPSTGTALQLKLANAREADKDIARIRLNAARLASDINEKAINASLQGQIARYEGRLQASAIRTQAVAQTFMTGSRIAGMVQ